MNERIRELLEHADMGYLFSKDEMLPGMVNPDSMKKFAELLVQDVLGVALYGDEFEQARANVKQYFEVEE